jgi:mannitol/fructose-specific phosphotransferase system IIA component (Ntr-type)
VPQRLVNDYLICVGTLARLLKDESIRTALMQAKTPAQFVDILKNAQPP